MARKGGGTVYVATNPNVPLSIGTPGVSVTLGPLQQMIYAPTSVTPPTGGQILLEDGDSLVTEAGDNLVTES